MTHFQKYEGYMGKKRKALVDEFGYDTKNAAHLIRLLHMGIEILVDGEVNVYREDSQKYISIKQGYWTLLKVQKEANRLFALLDEVYMKSTLPTKPNYHKAQQLLMNIIKNFQHQERVK